MASVEAFLQGCTSEIVGAFDGAFAVVFVGVAWACIAHAFQVGTVLQNLAVVAPGPLGRIERFHPKAGPAAEGPPHPEE